RRGPQRRDGRPNPPLTGEAIPPRPGEPIYTYEAAPQQEPSLLRNPYMLAGFAVAGAIFLAIVVVVFFGGGEGGNGGPGWQSTPGNVIIDPLTPQPGASGLLMRSIAMATVRDGPSNEFAAIGPLRAGL